MKKPPKRNATRKPVLYQRDAHVKSYYQFIADTFCCDPQDWTREQLAQLVHYTKSRGIHV